MVQCAQSLLRRGHIRIELENSQHRSTGLIELPHIAEGGDQIHAQGASARRTPERSLPKLGRFTKMSAFRLNDSQVGSGVDQIWIHGQCSAKKLACLGRQAVLLLNVGKRGQQFGISGDSATAERNKASA